MGIRRSRTVCSALAILLVISLFYLYRSPFSTQGERDQDSPKQKHLNDHGAVHSVPSAEAYGLGVHHYSDVIIQPTRIATIVTLPTPAKTQLPRVQHDFAAESNHKKGRQQVRLNAVKDAMRHTWSGYSTYAWGKDELAPLTKSYRQTFGGWAATMIDSLDTLWLMDMKLEFEEAVHFVSTIDFSDTKYLPINVFETTIRYLGGLLGAFDVSDAQYPTLLKKAVEVGDMLYGAFSTPNRMPVTRWSKISVEVAAGDTLIAELASLSLEFTRLSQLTGDMKYYDAVSRITDCVASQQMNTKISGLLPQFVNARECDFSQNPTFGIGAMMDSAYEYMVKAHQLLGGSVHEYEMMWNNSRSAITEHILFRPRNPDNLEILLAGTAKAFQARTDFDAQMQHLSCFAGGMFALAARIFDSEADLDTAAKLVDGCIWAYNSTQTGIMPELFHTLPCDVGKSGCDWDEELWSNDMMSRNRIDESPEERQQPLKDRMAMKQERLRLPQGFSAIASREYKLRPEAIESVFVMYRVTGKQYYREMGWTMFETIVEHTKTDVGFSSIEDVTSPVSKRLDKMESFWTAETLKYFWLLFEDENVMSLDEWVLSTEAHGFKLDWRG